MLFSGGTMFSPVASAEVSVTSKAEADALAASGTLVKESNSMIVKYYLNPSNAEKKLSVSGNYIYSDTSPGIDTNFNGGYRDSGAASGYTLTLENGTEIKNFWSCNLAGAYTTSGDATDNQLIIRGGDVDIVDYDTKTTKDNQSNSQGGTISAPGFLAGGVSADGNATGNSVIIESASLSGGLSPLEVIGGRASKDATDNRITVSGGVFAMDVYVIGGKSTEKGNANQNTVNITGGTFTSEYIAGGVSVDGNAVGNTVNLIGGDVSGTEVRGGYATATGEAAGTGEAKDNTVNVFAPLEVGGLRGGVVNAGCVSSGNTLNLYAENVTTGKMDAFQNINFRLPGTVKDESNILTVKDAVNLSGVTIGMSVQPGVSLKKGDKVNLIQSGVEITGGETKTLTTDPIAEDLDTDSVYTFLIKPEDANTNTFVAIVDGESETEETERTKSIVETRAATLTLLNSGADMLAEKGFAQAANAVALDAAEHGKNGGAETQKAGGFTPFAAFGGGSIRAESGSHVDTRGFSASIGFARELPNAQGRLLFGPVVEYGGGNYDSYLDDGTHGEGGAHYWGFGLMARQTNHDGLYYEGSVRGGRVTSDYKGAMKGIGETRYDSGTNYWAAHLGVGKAFQINAKNTLDGYLKYFYSHQAGEDITVQFPGLAIDGKMSFDSVDSHRVRLGARLTHRINEKNSFYGGLAYQYEFGGDARAHYDGNMTPSPSVKGSSGMLELGWQVKPGADPVTIDLGVAGWIGKQRGVTAGLQAMWSL